MEAAQKRKLARGPLGTRLPRAQAAAWAWAGISAPRVAPSWAKSGPTGAVRSWPLDQIGRLSVFFVGTKPAGAVSPPNPKTFLFLLLQATERRLAMVARGAAAPPPAAHAGIESSGR